MSDPTEAVLDPRPKIDPETLVLRGTPHKAVRFRRSAVIVVAGLGSVAIVGVAWLGLASPHAALAVLKALQAQTDRVEGFEILPDDSLDAALAEIPGTRAPLAGKHRWNALVEVTAHDAGEEAGEALLERLLAPLLADGSVEDAVLAQNEAQAEAFWHIRESLSEAERKAYGPATQHDLSVPVDRMPDFLDSASAAVEAFARWVRGQAGRSGA